MNSIGKRNRATVTDSSICYKVCTCLCKRVSPIHERRAYEDICDFRICRGNHHCSGISAVAQNMRIDIRYCITCHQFNIIAVWHSRMRGAHGEIEHADCVWSDRMDIRIVHSIHNTCYENCIHNRSWRIERTNVKPVLRIRIAWADCVVNLIKVRINLLYSFPYGIWLQNISRILILV